MSRLSDQRLMSGRAQSIGAGYRIPTPIDLDPTVHEGLFVYGDDQNCYFSDGTAWIIVSSGAIRRPTGLTALTAYQRRQLRLSKFSAAAGLNYAQIGVVFRASLFEDMRNPFYIEAIDSTSISSITLPQDFLPANTLFYWQGKYLATDNEESQYSKAISQVFPDKIEKPLPVTNNNATTLVLRVKPYESAFDYVYASTSWQIFYSPGSNLLINSDNTAVDFNMAEFNQILEPGRTYYWRARFNDVTDVSSGWSDLQSFVMDSFFTTRSSVDVRYYVGRTTVNGFGNLYTTPAIVLSSDNTQHECI